MRFRASDSYDYFRPSPCGLRVFLRSRGEPEAEPGAFDLLLRRLGLQHERRHLGTLPDVVDLSGLPSKEREQRTRLEIQAGVPALYQPRFSTQIVLDGTPCEVIGEPDFLIREGRGYVVRDAKLARRVGGGRHLAIALQLQLYGWLFERATGSPPVRLEVYSGAGQLVTVPQDPGAALGLLRWLKDLRLRTEEFYEPVGWSKCGGCAFQERCWSRAVASRDPAILSTVNQELARELNRRGVLTLDQLVSSFDESSLAALSCGPVGRRTIGSRAGRVLRSARAMSTGREEVVGSIDLPAPEDCVLFDLEGLPAYAEDNEKVYLWGMKTVTGEGAQFRPVLAGFGLDGDRKAWEEFLSVASGLLADRPSCRFVHWGSYERARLTAYVERYEDRDGTAARILGSLFDLHQALTRAVVLPLPSYGLKVIEKHVGFTRRLPEGRGDWAMARYVEAVEAPDPLTRARILGEILAYNEEDLDATRAVMEWLMTRAAVMDAEKSR